MQNGQTRPFTILVVEDELLIRAALREVLEDAGFAVREADCVAQAVELLVADASEIDFVFSDIQMPGAIDGAALADWIRDRYPDMPVMLASGHDVRSATASKHPFLSKPYDFCEVVGKIRAALLARQTA